MLVHFYIGVLIIASSNAKLMEDDFSDSVNTTLECIRTILNNGWPELNIPTHNPLELESYEVDFSQLGVFGLSGILKVKNLKVIGLTDWVTTKVVGTVIDGKLPKYQVDYEKVYPSLVLSGEYEIDWKYGGFDFWGAGSIEFDAVNYKEDIGFRATRSGGFSLEYFKFLVALDRFEKFVITGARNNEEYSALLSSMFSTKGGQIVSDLSEDINSIVGEGVLTYIIFGGGDEFGFIDMLLKRCHSQILL